MTTKYDDYKEYHTSLDKFDSTVNSRSLFRGYKLIKDLIISIEEEIFPISNFIGEPQMGSNLNEPSSFISINFLISSTNIGFPYGANPINLYSPLLTLKPVKYVKAE